MFVAKWRWDGVVAVAAERLNTIAALQKELADCDAKRQVAEGKLEMAIAELGRYHTAEEQQREDEARLSEQWQRMMSYSGSRGAGQNGGGL